MDYQTFTSEIQKEIMRQLPEQYQDVQATINKVTKNNGTEFVGLMLHRPGESVSPQLYLEQPYEQFKNGEPVEKIAGELADAYLQSRDVKLSDVTELVSDFEKAQELLQLQLINKEYNREKLKDTPHKDLRNTDLTAVLRLHLPTGREEEQTILVSDAILSKWNKTMEDLYAAALRNTMSANPPRMNDLLDLITGGGSNRHLGNEVENYKMAPRALYLLSNSAGINGATVLLYPDVLEQLAQKANANLFILPSSIHECMILKDAGELNAGELQAMVMSVNREEVQEEERLSDEVYYYDKDEHCLSMATAREETEELKDRLFQTGHVDLVQEAEMEMEER